MNTHNPHRIRALALNIYLTEIHLILLKLLDIAYKMKQSPVTGGFEIHRFFDQHLQVRFSLFSARKRRRVSAVSGPFQDFRQQLVDRRIRHFPTHFLQQEKKVPEFSAQRVILSVFRILRTCLIDFLILSDAFDIRQFPCAASNHRRAEHCGKRDLLHRIVADLEIIQDCHNLPRGKIPGSGSTVSRNSRRLQHPLERLRPSADRSEQNHNVPVGRRAAGTRFFVQHLLLADQFPNTRSNHMTFRLDHCLPAVVVLQLRRFPVQKKDLRMVIVLIRRIHSGGRFRNRILRL